jgi:hypothetical protein
VSLKNRFFVISSDFTPSLAVASFHNSTWKEMMNSIQLALPPLRFCLLKNTITRQRKAANYPPIDLLIGHLLSVERYLIAFLHPSTALTAQILKMSPGNFVDDDRFDGLYLNVAQAAQGIEPLLDTVFSFLRRKTDFFKGPPGSGDKGTEAAIEKVHEVLQKHADLYLKEQQKLKKKTTETAKPKKKKVEEESVIEMGKDGGFDASEEKSTAKKTSPVAASQEEPKKTDVPKKISQEEPEKSDVSKKSEPSDSDDPGPPPEGNGGMVEGKYVWTQTLSEVNANILVPDNTRGRDLNITIAKKHLKVGLRSQPGTWIVDAPLCKPIIVDDSFWTVEDGNRLAINLQKSNQMEWWDCVCQGDPKIDVRAVRPESSSVSDLEGETRKTVEKMMYDQRQKAMGLPSSDEEEKLNMLEKFKKQHPEMDFSNVKMS